MTTDRIAKLMKEAAETVCEVLANADVDAESTAFAVVVWPVEDPSACSVICGSGDITANYHARAALQAASEKTKGDSLPSGTYQTGKAN